MYAGTALSNQKKTKGIPVIYMSLLVLKELAKERFLLDVRHVIGRRQEYIKHA